MMMRKKKKGFIDEFVVFYRDFMANMAENVSRVAQMQAKYPEQYKAVNEFSRDPEGVKMMLKELEVKEQAVLLITLFQAGQFAGRFVNLMDLSVKEQKKLAKDSREFSEELANYFEKERDSK